ncbi:MAG: CoA ester lyase [Ectothiorhodospiraceae bacterium]|nr:CoA ester lyase [Ectothiorhodospiraceae bacterium]
MADRPVRPRRSLIFAPGNKPEMLPKAMASGADIVTVDLEDAIAPNHKAVARERTLAAFATLEPDPRVEPIVRVNCLRTPEGMADLLAIVEAKRPPPALMLPKIKSPDEIRVYEEVLGARCEHVRLHVIIETNEGLEACIDIARSSDRIDALLFGGVDMAAELRVEPQWEGLLYARARVVHAAASAGVDVVDVPYLDLGDMAGMEREARACAALGFTGKGAIHPKQIETLNRVFSPTPEQIATARRVVEEFERGDTGLVVIDNKLIEKPVLRSMYRILAVAERL